MACGLPVVATSAPGIEDIFDAESSQAGWSFPPRMPRSSLDA
jgi:glycosyltransferase involved in cell wall biosynthesis